MCFGAELCRAGAAAQPLGAYLVLSVLAGALGGLTALMQWGMVGEVIDYNEYLTGKRTEGSIYGTFNLMRRVGQAIGTAGAVALLDRVGYLPGAAEQSAGAVLGLEVITVLLPAVFVLLCWVSLRFLWNMTPELRAEMAAARNVRLAHTSHKADSEQIP